METFLGEDERKQKYLGGWYWLFFTLNLLSYKVEVKMLLAVEKIFEFEIMYLFIFCEMKKLQLNQQSSRTIRTKNVCY